MNKLILMISLALLSYTTYGQWSNPQSGKVTTTDNVGIGTISPSSKLDVRGATRFDGANNGSTGIGDGYTHLPHSNGNNYIRGNTYIGTSGEIQLSAATKTSIMGGNVGIGTTTPSAKLHIQSTGISALIGSDVSSSSRTNATRKFGRIGAPHYFNSEEPMAGFVFDSDGSGNMIWIGGGTNQFNTATEIRFATASSHVNQGSNNFDNVRMVINSSGNIGIGTDNIPTRLTLASDQTKILTFNRTGNLKNAHIGYGTVNEGGLYLGTDDSQYSLWVQQNGNVGIGTYEPTQKLSVAGTINADELILEDVSGADFVFEEDYDLRSLEETEKFIQTNQHLPEIPSAAEMAEEGLEIKVMNILLLQKVEELTLHLIEQNKRMNQLEEKNAELEKEISALKN
ncbi:MAG: hypothetical protein R8G66_01915 [Cytophagales bacterium]|nr:hypothetical protein [Cytophagales bacterium]